MVVAFLDFDDWPCTRDGISRNVIRIARTHREHCDDTVQEPQAGKSFTTYSFSLPGILPTTWTAEATERNAFE